MRRSHIACATLLVVTACGTPESQTEPVTPVAEKPVAGQTPATPPEPCSHVSLWQAQAPQDPPLVGEELVRQYLKACGRAQAVALTQALVRFPTVSAREPAATGAAFRDMAAYLSAFAAQHGLGFNVIGENDAWEVTLGEGPRKLGYVVHADVVPEAETPAAPGALPTGWTHPPFEATLDGDKLYGRGTEDDKAPLAVVLTLLAALSDAGLATKEQQLVLIIGTGEESNWDGMERYAGSQPLPLNVISVDATFPVVVGEAGFVSWTLAVPFAGHKAQGKAIIIEAKAGEFFTQVPGDATMTLAKPTKETLEAFTTRVLAAIASEEKARGTTYQFKSAPGSEPDTLAVSVVGKAVHSSTAETGHNALWPLASLAQRIGVEPNGYGAIFKLIAQKFDGDHNGEKLGVTYKDNVMGKLTVAPTLLRRDEANIVLRVNMRRPAGMNAADFSTKLDGAMTKLKRDIDARFTEPKERYIGEPHLVTDASPLVGTLLEVYRAHSGDSAAKPITIRGGTYARLFPGAVSFGPSIPGKPYRGHAPDEYIELSAIDALTSMLFDATLKLSR